MKKSYLMILAAVSLFASCYESDTFKGAAQEVQADQPLSFTAYADKVTKAGNSTALNDFYTAFGVYGWKTVNGTVVSDPVFSNIPNEYFTEDKGGSIVYKTSGKPSTEWTVPDNIGVGEGKKGYWYYENVRYWDKMASQYQFFAIAPFESTPTYTVSAGDANISIATYDISGENNLALVDDGNSNLIPQANLAYTGFKKDYMIADKLTPTPKGTVTTQDVQLVFHHILTKLNVKVKKSDLYKGSQVLKVSELKIENLKKEANFEYTTNMTTDGWKNKADIRTIDINTPYALANGATETPAMTDYPDNYWIETLIFPQTTTCMAAGAQPTPLELTGMYLYIQYMIGNETFNAYYDLAYVFDPTTAPVAATYYTAAEAAAYNEANDLSSGDEGFAVENGVKTQAQPGKDFEFKQGSQYNLIITVGPEPIHFDARVIEWDTADQPTSLSAN